MKKDIFNMFQSEYDDPEEKAQAEKEEIFFRKLMTCGTILTGSIAAVLVLIFLYLYFQQ